MSRKLEAKLNKKLKIVEFDHALEGFVKKLCFPAKVKDIQFDGQIITITPLDLQSRGLIIGREAKILRSYEAIVQRYFQGIKEIKVR